MCMKYINAVITPYRSVSLAQSGEILSLTAPLKTVSVHTVAGPKAHLENFPIVTDINFLGTTKDDHKDESPMERGETVQFILRLTKCAKDPEKRVYADLDRFSVDLSGVKDEHMASQACFDFYNYTRVTRIPDDVRYVPMNGEKPLTGKYVLKLIIVRGEKEIVQSMTALDIVEANGELIGETVPNAAATI